MELFIRIKDGQPFEHPIFGDNFRQAFPDVDVNNLPPEFMRFERIERPQVGPYEIYEGVTYEIQNGVCKDVHHVRQMSAEEKSIRMNEIKIEVIEGVENLKKWAAARKLEDAEGMQEKWQKYIDGLNAVSFEGDPVLIVLPIPPNIEAQLSANGGAPNVIG